MASPNTTPVEETGRSSDIVRELLVEVFLARGATHHDDLDEAADELRELFRQLDILTPGNAALIDTKVALLERRARRSRLRLVGHDPEPPSDAE